MPTNQEYFAELKSLLDAQTALIASESTVDDSLIALADSYKAANDALLEKIASLAIDPAVVQQIRDLFASNAAAQQANIDKVNAAVVANTPVAPPTP